MLRKFGNAHGTLALRKKPLLRIQYRAVSMFRFRVEFAVKALFPSGRVDEHKTRCFQHHCRAEKPLGEP